MSISVAWRTSKGAIARTTLLLWLFPSILSGQAPQLCFAFLLRGDVMVTCGGQSSRITGRGDIDQFGGRDLAHREMVERERIGERWHSDPPENSRNRPRAAPTASSQRAGLARRLVPRRLVL